MQEILIEAGRTERRYWRDLWDYRELFYFLTWRDILVRYKQTVAGATWAIIRPLITMLVLTLVFGKLANMPSGGVPYPILVFCGMLPWQFFSTAVTDCGNSLVMNSQLISKVYFPRMAVPASSVMTSLLDLFVAGVLLVVMMAWYQYVPGPRVLLLPAFIVMAFAAAFGIGLWTSALMVRYRDFRFIVPFAVQFGLYISPVGFSSSIVPQEWRLLYSANPIAGVIDGFRWAILGADMFWAGFVVSLVVVLALLLTGIAYFRSTERTFADEI